MIFVINLKVFFSFFLSDFFFSTSGQEVKALEGPGPISAAPSMLCLFGLLIITRSVLSHYVCVDVVEHLFAIDHKVFNVS